ncbi:MAG: glycosyltransferase family 2 protein [Syntrophales bacterium]
MNKEDIQIEISAVIASWNTKDILLQCLRSLVGSLGRFRSEIIVVDNASSDGSPQSVEAAFPEVRVLRNSSNLGFARANNTGIRNSTGRYVCLVNSDVIVREGCIDRMHAYMEKHPETGMLGPKILGPDGSVQRSCMGFPTVWNSLCRAMALDSIFPERKMFGGQLLTYWPHDTLKKVDVINGCFWLIRRSALDQVGLLDESFFMYAEDIDWCRRFHEKGWSVVFLPDAEAVHYGGASSALMPVRFYIEKQRANLQYWRKYHSAPARSAYFSTLVLHEIVRLLFHCVPRRKKGPKSSESVLKIKRSIACLRWLLLDHAGPH